MAPRDMPRIELRILGAAEEEGELEARMGMLVSRSLNNDSKDLCMYSCII
jgi:hypothetical protein